MSWLTPEVTMAANQEEACYVDNQKTRDLEQGRERNKSSIQILQLNKFVLEMKITVTVRLYALLIFINYRRV